MNPQTLFMNSPLRQAQEALKRIQRTARLASYLPLPIILVTILALVLSSSQWSHDLFLAFFLALIFVVFVAGQIVAWVQLRRMRPAMIQTENTLRLLVEAGEDPNLEELRQKMLSQIPESPLRDLILRWLDLGIEGNLDGYETLLENDLDRRTLHDNGILSLHSTINRTTLKLGFLGTLIGIILTFPPMKRAVLGLSDSDGELKFIRDIAMAIDGDQYAILSTLAATGLSILVEFVTIQTLEHILTGFDVVQSRVNDWKVVCLQPAIARRREDKGQTEGLEGSQARLELALMQAQQTMESHLTELTGAMHTAGMQLDQVLRIQAAVGKRVEELSEYDKLATAMLQSQQALEMHLAGLAEGLRTSASQLGQVVQVQSLVGKRVTELNEYEKQYRSFLAAKQQATAPSSLRGEA
jgi:DNA-binding transcriptional ArsR family regulator